MSEESLQGIIGPQLMRPSEKEKVVEFLQRVPIPRVTKRQLLVRWSREVDGRITQADLAKL